MPDRKLPQALMKQCQLVFTAIEKRLDRDDVIDALLARELEQLNDLTDLCLQSVDDEVTASSSTAAALGRRGGAVASEAQKAAARENGKKGGRPVGSTKKHNKQTNPEAR